MVIGWGATCGRHHNDATDETVCKKQVPYKDRHGYQVSDDDCRRMAKHWLVQGLMLEETAEGPRSAHLSINPRGLDSVAEDTLDEIFATCT